MPDSEQDQPKNPFFKKTIFYAAWRCLVEWSFAPFANYLEDEWDTVKNTAKNSSGICFLFAVIFLTLGYLWKGHNEEPIETSYSVTNSFLSGQLSEMSNEVQHLQNQLDKNQQDYENKIAGIKTDFNEAKREQDAHIAELNSEKESAQARLSFFEANPEKLSEIYSNIFAHTPTNFEQVDSMFAQYNMVLSNNLTEIETTTKQLQQSASQSQNSTNQFADQLAGLGIEKLPDGRIKMGNQITGNPSVVIEAFNAGFQSYSNRDFNSALENFQKGINAFETTHITGPVIMIGGGDINPEGKSELYGMAAECAMQIHSNSLAIEYAQKSVVADPQPKSKLLLTFTIANFAQQTVQSNDITGSFELYQKAITNYESIGNFDFVTNLDVKSDIIKLFSQGVRVANFIGKTNEANSWQEKLAAILKL